MRHPSYRRIAQVIRHREDRGSARPLTFPEEDAELLFVPFASSSGGVLLGHPGYVCDVHGLAFAAEETGDDPADRSVGENLRFTYPLLRSLTGSGEASRCKRVTVILHGLNERSFTKYIPWAYQLWRATGTAVVLFPLTFHVNRGLPRWGQEAATYRARRGAIPGNEDVHSFNAVNSERLGSHPERFFWGGVQTLRDLVDLVKEVRRGTHREVDPAARVDLVGFSAGGYLALVLLLMNPEDLFGESRAVIFESGGALCDTFLSSRFIVDLAAETAMMKLYVRHTARFANARLAHWLEAHEEGRWFRSLCGLEVERPRLEERLASLAPRVLGIANLNDQVVPARAMLDTLQGLHRDTGIRVEELALGIHENPFGCASYGERDRVAITESLDLLRYGAQFERFVALASGLLA